MNKAEVVRDLFASYVRQDRDTAERLIAESFVFTSPRDDHIDRAAYFERCFPTSTRMRRYDLLHVTPTGGDDVFVLYEYELHTGEAPGTRKSSPCTTGSSLRRRFSSVAESDPDAWL